MYWIDGQYTITVNGVPQFQAANPAGGVANGTEITAAWLNDVQGELLNVVTQGGLTPAESTPTQVATAIQALIKAQTGVKVGKVNLITFTTSGTYVPSANLLFAQVCAKAGGGGGGVGDASGSGVIALGGGGGEGAFVEGFLTAAQIGASQSVIIGAGGAGGTVSNWGGSTGGTTSLGSLFSADGGVGGVGISSTSGTTGGGGGAGGSGGSGSLITPGAPGGNSNAGTTNTAGMGGGNGGAPSVGVAGSSPASVTGNGGFANSGGGGGGGVGYGSAANGGAGGSGFLKIIEYIGG